MRDASEPVDFETGGGTQPSAKTIGIVPVGHTNVMSPTYMLPECPVVRSMGLTVLQEQRAFIWDPREAKPYWVLDVSKLVITCPKRNRWYATEVKENVPHFSSPVVILPGLAAGAASRARGSNDPAPSDDPPGLDAPPGAPSDEEEGPLELHIADSEPEDPAAESSQLPADHWLTHLPKSRFCEVCRRAKCFSTPRRRLAAQSADRRAEEADRAPKEYLDRVYVDHAIFGEGHRGRGGENCSLRVLDAWSGIARSFPARTKETPEVTRALREFSGRKAGTFMVRMASDRAPELRASCEQLGWIAEQSTPNTRIHNAVAERGIRTAKEGASCNLLQAGLSHKDWPLALSYHDIVRSLTDAAPNDGPADPRFGRTKYEVATGRSWTARLLPFGCLVYYRPGTGKVGPCDAKTLPGLYLGPEITSEWRYRGNSQIADLAALGKDQMTIVVTKEIVVPNSIVFPLAAALRAAEERGVVVTDLRQLAQPVDSSFSPPGQVEAEEEPSGLGGSSAEHPPEANAVDDALERIAAEEEKEDDEEASSDRDGRPLEVEAPQFAGVTLEGVPSEPDSAVFAGTDQQPQFGPSSAELARTQPVVSPAPAEHADVKSRPAVEPASTEADSEAQGGVRITMRRIERFGRTAGCKACAQAGGSMHHHLHSSECRARFNQLVPNAAPVGRNGQPIGVVSAVAAVSDFLAEAAAVFSPEEANELQSVMQDHLQALCASSAYTKRVSGCIAAVSALPAVAVGANMLLEFCCSPESQLGKTSSEHGIHVIRLHKAFADLMDPMVIEQILCFASSHPGISMHASIPCTPWSVWQNMAIHRYGQRYIDKLEQKRKQSLIMLRHCFMIARVVIEGGGHFSFEWPRFCSGWLRCELLEFIVEFDLSSAVFDGCSFGLVDKTGTAIKKPWRMVTTSKTLAHNLSQHTCMHKGKQEHSLAEGSKTAATAFYPPALCECIIRSLFKSSNKVAAMPLVLNCQSQRAVMPTLLPTARARSCFIALPPRILGCLAL